MCAFPYGVMGETFSAHGDGLLDGINDKLCWKIRAFEIFLHCNKLIKIALELIFWCCRSNKLYERWLDVLLVYISNPSGIPVQII